MRAWILVAGLLPALSGPAGAAVVLINNGLDCSNPGNVIDHATYQSDDVVVRNVGCGTPDPGSPCPSPGEATEVCVEVGGEVSNLWVYDSSAITMNGGTVGQELFARGSSAVTINGGLVERGMEAVESSSVTMNDGAVKIWVLIADLASLTLNGGALAEGLYVQVFNSATFTMNGGWVELLRAEDSSSVTIEDGTVAQDVEAYGSSAVTLKGGTVQNVVAAYDSTSFMMSGGSMIALLAFGSSTSTISGGTWQGLLGAIDSSTIEVMGSGFAVDGSRVPYGDLSAETGRLTGRLASGDPVDNAFHQGGGDYTGTITLTRVLPAIRVPALSLSGKLLLAAALIGFGAVHRRRSRAA